VTAVKATRSRAMTLARVVASLVVGVVAMTACDDSKPMPPVAKFTPDPNVVRIETEQDFDLLLQSVPRPLTAIVTRQAGEVDTVRITVATPEDTSVVRVVDNALVPTGVGYTKLFLEVSGRPITARVTVTDRIADEEIALSSGEVRAWELAPGWYNIAVHRADTSATSPLQLAAPLTCAPDSRDADAISCRVQEATRIVLKHSGRGGRATAHISIVQVQRWTQ